jgi:hypothetical protein
VTPGILTSKNFEFLYWIVTSSKGMPTLKKQECVIKYGVHGLLVVTPGRLTDQKIKFLYKLFN